MSDAEWSPEAGDERRRTPRIYVPFHASVHGVNKEGEEFNVETVLDNICGDGLCMRMMPRVETGTKLSVEIGLYTPLQAIEGSPRVLVDGKVLRVEKKRGGVCAVAMEFERVRFP